PHHHEVPGFLFQLPSFFGILAEALAGRWRRGVSSDTRSDLLISGDLLHWQHLPSSGAWSLFETGSAYSIYKNHCFPAPSVAYGSLHTVSAPSGSETDMPW